MSRRPHRILRLLRELLPAALYVALITVAVAQAPAGRTAREIEGLFASLSQSDCRFQRNGRWYTAAKATEHLRRKYDYIQRKGKLASAERFIELAATRSSVSGSPYQVQCGTAPQVSSARWFGDRLAALRAAEAP